MKEAVKFAEAQSSGQGVAIPQRRVGDTARRIGRVDTLGHAKGRNEGTSPQRGESGVVEREPDYLELLANHELRNSERFRRFFTVVVLDYDTDRWRFRQLFSGTLRASDEVVESVSCVTVLMGETDREGAMTAVERLQHVYGGLIHLRFGAASYPNDARDVQSLLSIARSRLSEAEAEAQ